MINFNNLKIVKADGSIAKAEVEHTEKNGVHKFSVLFGEDCTAKEAVLFSDKHDIAVDSDFYGDGYQKLSQYGGTVGNPQIISDYSDRDHYKMPQTDGFFTAYNFVIFSINGSYLLIGATSCNRFRTELRFNSSELVVAQSLESLSFSKGDKIALEEMMILTSTDKNALLEAFADRISVNHPVKKCYDFPIGWCSWYCIGPNISERKIFKSLKNIKKKLPQIKYIQIDDGFQPFMGDWLEVGKKFRRNMAEICADIKREGFEPAIWLAPFIASKKSRLLREHPEYFISDDNGKPLCCEGVTFRGWRDAPWYMLDGTNPEARQYIYNVVKTIRDKWGVKYYKLDANVWGALPFGNRMDKNATCIEAYRLMMKTICDAAGEESFILGCNAPMWPSLGLVTGMRVTNDTFRNVPTMENIAAECFWRNWMHGKLWVNDPDCLLITNARSRVVDPAGKRTKASKNQNMFKFNAVYIRASGGSILSGDPIKNYTDSDISVFNKLISLPKIAASFDSNFEIGTIAYDNTTEYCLFNMTDTSKTHHINIPENSTAKDMYSGELLETFENGIDITLEPHSAEWIAVVCK